MVKRAWARFLFAALSAAASGEAFASDARAVEEVVKEALQLTPNLDNGRELYKVCAVCHTPEAWGTSNGYYPQLAGQLPGVTIKQMADIQLKNRDNPTMYPFAMPSSFGGAQEMADVAAYIATLPMDPDNGVGPGFDLWRGERLYAQLCADCHGRQGEGDSRDQVPLIQGQHYEYLVRQFRWIAMGKRRNADSEMVKQIQSYRSPDISAMMDYVSRIRPPVEKLAERGHQNPDFPAFSRSALPRSIYHSSRGRR